MFKSFIALGVNDIFFPEEDTSEDMYTCGFQNTT